MKKEFWSAEYASNIANHCPQLSARICQLHTVWGMQLTFLCKKMKEHCGLSDICRNFAAQ